MKKKHAMNLLSGGFGFLLLFINNDTKFILSSIIIDGNTIIKIIGLFILFFSAYNVWISNKDDHNQEKLNELNSFKINFPKNLGEAFYCDVDIPEWLVQLNIKYPDWEIRFKNQIKNIEKCKTALIEYLEFERQLSEKQKEHEFN